MNFEKECLLKFIEILNKNFLKKNMIRNQAGPKQRSQKMDSFEIAVIFPSPYRRGKKRGNFK